MKGPRAHNLTFTRTNGGCRITFHGSYKGVKTLEILKGLLQKKYQLHSIENLPHRGILTFLGLHFQEWFVGTKIEAEAYQGKCREALSRHRVPVSKEMALEVRKLVELKLTQEYYVDLKTSEVYSKSANTGEKGLNELVTNLIKTYPLTDAQSVLLKRLKREWKDSLDPIAISLAFNLTPRALNSSLEASGLEVYSDKYRPNCYNVTVSRCAEGKRTLLTRMAEDKGFVKVGNRWFYGTSKEQEEFRRGIEGTTRGLTLDERNALLSRKNENDESSDDKENWTTAQGNGRKGDLSKKADEVLWDETLAKWGEFNSVEVDTKRGALICRGIPVEEVILKLLSFLTTKPTSIALDPRSFIYGKYSGIGTPAGDVLYGQVQKKGRFRAIFRDLLELIELVKQLEQLGKEVASNTTDDTTSEEWNWNQGDASYQVAAATGAFCTETIAQKTIVKCTDTKKSEVVNVDDDKRGAWSDDESVDDEPDDAWGDYESDDDLEREDNNNFGDYKDFGDGAW